MPFTYFIPDAASLAAPDIARLGLSHAFDVQGRGPAARLRGITTTRVIGLPAGGPLIGSGLLVTAGPTPGRYDPASQTWTQSPAGHWYVGHETAAPPTPADLQREEIIDGHAVTLEDGNAWIVPLARSFSGASNIPRALAIGPDGRVVGRSLPRFVGLTRTADKVAGWVYGGQESPLIEDAFAAAALILAVNYRVSAAELSALGVLSTANLSAIFEALVDVRGFKEAVEAQREAAKKKNPAPTPDGSPTGSGATADDPPTTPPPTPSSASTPATTPIPPRGDA